MTGKIIANFYLVMITGKDVIPAHAGIHKAINSWIPACAGMTV
jgi:hypothetical protein